MYELFAHVGVEQAVRGAKGLEKVEDINRALIGCVLSLLSP